MADGMSFDAACVEQLLELIGKQVRRGKSWEVAITRPCVPDVEQEMAFNGHFRYHKPGPDTVITVRVKDYDYDAGVTDEQRRLEAMYQAENGDCCSVVVDLADTKITGII